MGLDMYLRTDDDEQAAYWRKANAIHAWFVTHVQDGIDECQDSPVTRAQLTELRDLCQGVLDGIELTDGPVQRGTRGTATGWEPIIEKGQIITNPEFIEKRLPSQGGFFFGSTDYDDDYVADLRQTVERIDAALTAHSGDFIYHSSW